VYPKYANSYVARQLPGAYCPSPMKNAAILLATVVLSTFLGACVAEEDAQWGEEDEYGEATSAITGSYVAFEPAYSDEDFLNPERGYYTGYNLRAAGDASTIRGKGYSLVIAIVNLEDYKYKSLDSTVLNQLTAGFAKLRSAGVKAIVRFTYNNGYTGDASLSRIQGHVSQLKSIFSANSDVIAVVQAGLIGAWGEWHSSTHNLDNTTARNAVIQSLLASVPSNRSVQIRTPMYKDAYRPGGPTTAAEAYGGSSKSRLGHHNDCFLASESDMGTFASPLSTWKGYVANDTMYVPNGGETCAVYTPKTTCSAAVAEMATMHFSYLNRAYNGTVINGWVTGGCDSEIKRRLGYRFGFRRIAHTSKVAPGGVLEMEIDIRNYGFAAPYNARPVDIVLIKGSSRYTARLSFDARRLPAGLKTRVNTKLRLPANLPTGTYTIALRMPDASSALKNDPRYAIRLANSGTWDATTGDNIITKTFVVDSSASGEKDMTATTFKEIL
jgi:hypothetical protein